jgi:HAMP domain-containing protein
MVSYGYLATLVLVGAGAAALAFQQLGDNISSVLGENFRSVQEGISMLESLERQDSAALALLLGQSQARSQVATADNAFLESLEGARNNITIEEEAEILIRVEDRFDAYRRVRDEVLAESAERKLLDYETRALPRFNEVKAGVRELIDVNHAAMVRADTQARRAAISNAALHALLIALALLSMAPLSASLRRHVFARLSELREVSTAISAGDLGRRLDDRNLDELGLAARQLNRVLDRYEMLEAELAGHRARERSLVRSLLANLPHGAVLFSPSGQLLESTVDTDLAAVVRGAAQQQVTAMDEPAKVTFSVDGRPVTLLPLRPGSGPEVAWLALLDDAAPASAAS